MKCFIGCSLAVYIGGSDPRRRRFAPEYRGVAPGKFVKRGRRPPKQRTGVGPYPCLLAIASLGEQFEQGIGQVGWHSSGKLGLPRSLRRDVDITDGLSSGSGKLFRNLGHGQRFRSGEGIDLALVPRTGQDRKSTRLNS